jgi:hypothetical protein
MAALIEVPLPSHITIETVPLPGDNDPNRCVGWAFAEFPIIRGAKRYELTVLNTRAGTRKTYSGSGPKFPDDSWDDYPAHFDVHKGHHWFALSGYSTGAGCADAILAFEGAYKIVRSRVTKDTEDKQEEKPACDTESVYTRDELKKAKPRGIKVDLPIPGLDTRGKRVIVKRRGPGQVFTIDPGSNQPVNLMNNRYMTEGRIITDPQGGFVQIGLPFTTKKSFLVAPGMTIEIKNGKARILEYDPSGWSTKKVHEFLEESVRKGGCPDTNVRTNSSVLSVRG